MPKKITDAEYEKFSKLKAKQQANHNRINQYNKDNYDRVVIMLPKGKKDKLKAYAEENGLSVNAIVSSLISDLID